MMRRLLLLLGVALLCLGILPVTAYAAGTEGYEVSTDWVTGTTTYKVTSLEDIYNSSLQPEGDAILDFTKCDPLSPGKSESLIISVQKEDAHVTIRGVEGTNYGNVTLNISGSVAGVTLQDFQTRSSLVNYGGEGACELVYDGECVIDLQLGGADYAVRAADDASHLALGFALQENKKGSMTFSGNLSVDRSLTSEGAITVQDAFVSHITSDSFGTAIIAPQLTIESSTINGVGHINSFEYPSYDTVAIDAFDGSFIMIENSQISFDAHVGGNASATVLGNSETITIKDSVVSGIEVTSGYGCLGGTFENIFIEGSEVYAQSDYDAAIGPNDAAYGSSGFSKFGITSPSISIEDSVVEAASTYGAAIGMPRLSESYLKGDRPTLSVTISGSSDVTATSVRSAAIGAGTSKSYSSVDGVEIEVGAGDITWGRSSNASPLSMLFNLLGLDTGSELEGQLAMAAELLDDCAVTIEGSPTIRAKSGVIAIYADSVTVTDTNLVQDTMVIEDGSDEYSVYPMETPGAVKIGSESIGELGYGYASVAATGVSAQSNAAMTFGGASLTDAENGEKQFSVSANGIHSFFTTPTLALSGSVSITGATDGVATVGTTLGLDLNELVPSRAAANTTDCLTFQWYRDGSEISSATSSSYALTSADGGKVITCVVTGRGFFEGSVTSDAVLVGSQTTVPAPTLASRTENSITLANVGENYEYRIVGNGSWQETPEFTNLAPGTTYVFQRRDSSNNVSAPASFSTLFEAPNSNDFRIDYESETLSFPSGVHLYSDPTCMNCLNKNSAKTSIGISDLVDEGETTLYARYATVDPADTDSVTTVAIPGRPAAPELPADVTAKANSISFTGLQGVTYRLLVGGRVVEETGTGQQVTFGGLSPATEYTVQMRFEASNEAQRFRSAVSEKNVETAASAPAAPELHVQAERVGEGYESVRVGFSWDRPATNGAAITGYAIYAQADGGASVEVWKTGAGDAALCEVTASADGVLKPGGTYTFTLRASWIADDASGTAISDGVWLTLPSLRPDPAAFVIDYLNERLTVPVGVDLYEDATCETQITPGDGEVSITRYIAANGGKRQSLYARLSSAKNDPDAVTEVSIPTRPYVSPVSSGGMTLKHNYLSLRKDWLNLDTCTYELMLDDKVIEPTTDTTSVFIFENLEPNTPYALVITKKAVASTADAEGSFSSSVTQTITTKAATASSSELLVPESESSSTRTIAYDLTTLLDGAEIESLDEGEDTANILTSWYRDGDSGVSLGLGRASVGDAATVVVEAQDPESGDYLMLTLALKVVDVMAEGEDVTYWVRSGLSEEETGAVKSALGGLLDDAALLGAFDLEPRNPVGGGAVTDPDSAQVTWEFTEGMDTTGTFDVYRIDGTSAAKLEGVTKTSTGIQFNVTGAGGRYAVVHTKPQLQTFQITAAQVENGSFEMDKQQAAKDETVTVKPKPRQGFELDALTVTANSGSSVSTTPLDSGSYTFTMPADDVTVSGTFAPITPAAPVLTATYEADKNAVVVSWTAKEGDAVITGYSLAVTLDDEDLDGSPFSLSATDTSYTLNDPESGTYRFTLTANNNEASATPITVEVTVPEPVAPTYNVNVATVEHGSFSASRESAEEGATVTVTATPEEGYKTASVTVTDASSAAVPVTEQANGTYTFTMPASGVTVSGTFQKVAGDDDPDEGDLNALLEEAFTEEGDFEAITLSTGTYKLTGDLSVGELAGEREGLKTTSLYIGNGSEPATVELDLAGCALDADDCAIIVPAGSTLEITDSSDGGSVSGKKGLSYEQGGTKYAYAGGVAVYGTLNMYGGSITGNQAAGNGVLGYGGGVYVFGGGTFNMYGGTISGNTASTQGGGVAVRSATDTTPVPNPLYIDGTEITGWEEVDGGDVSADLSASLLSTRTETESSSSAGAFNLYGGTIADNSAPVAGGVYAGGNVTIGVDASVFTSTNITVANNTSGNLYVPADVTVALSAKPAEGSRIGVTMEMAPGLFAKADSEIASSSRGSFSSDSVAYYVTTRQDGLALARVPSAPTYEPDIVIPGGGGTVTTDPSRPNQGDEVTITPKPDEGYVVDSVGVIDKDGEPVEVTDNGDGTWTFVQPVGSVTITVTFTCTGGAHCPSAGYPDVDQSQWYHAAVDWVIANGVMTGYGDSPNFGPSDPLSRAQMAQILWRLAGEPEADASSLPEDCTTGAWYEKCVAWVLSNGCFTGYDDGTFGPADALTREQAATVLWRLASSPEGDADLSAFPDADEVSEFAEDALRWAVSEGVVEGDLGFLAPTRAVTRAEMAALLMRSAVTGR